MLHCGCARKRPIGYDRFQALRGLRAGSSLMRVPVVVLVMVQTKLFHSQDQVRMATS